MGYFANISVALGIPIWALLVAIAWSFVWKLLALWKSARKGSVVWFIVLALVNTLGILEILYIFVFSEMGKKPQKKSVRKKSSKRKR